MRTPALALTTATVVLAVAGCGGSSSGSKQAAATATDTVSTPTTATATTPVTVPGCTVAKAPPTFDARTHEAKPKGRLSAKHHWTVVLDTNCGRITIALAVREAPITTSSFAGLVRRGFYDDLTFHRIATDFVIQGGDPLGTGGGGPGYSVVEPPPGTINYSKGTVAMAKTEAEPPGTSGSQFFIVSSSAGASALTPDYALVGHVTAGMRIVERINSVPASPDTQMPLSPVVIRSATLHG